MSAAGIFADLLLLIERHQLKSHAFDDDGFCCPSEVELLSGRVSVCIDEVSMWMTSNRLQLNHAKTEVIWFSSLRRQHQIPLAPVRIGSTSILPVQSVRDLGEYLNTDVSLTTHVTAVVRSCFASLRQIRSVRRSLPQHGLLTLIRASSLAK